ncbi:MAG: hypothetical protein CV087_17605 [Candidatus Brocadia sp. WS118]|nr:MAG: hypothetical protein CV087_17605 [Candidatus Brocadia sp. WS118]
MARTKNGLPGIYNSSPITLSSEDGGALALDSSGRVVLGTSTASVGTVTLGAGTAIVGAVKQDVVNWTVIRKYLASGDTNENTVWDPTAGKKFVITDIVVSATAAGTCTLRDGTGGSTIMILSFAANGGWSSNLTSPIISATADNNLTIQASAATQYIMVTGYEI